MQGLRIRRRTDRLRGDDLLVVAGLAVFVGAVYAVVVLGGGQLTGDTQAPSPALSVLATAVVAVAFDPVRRRLAAWTAHVSKRPISAPSQVISRFLSGTAAGTAPGEATRRMARALVEGLGLEEAQVWVVVGGRMRLAGAHPEPAEPAGPPEPPDVGAALQNRVVRGIWHGDELLGALSLRTRGEHVLAPVEDQLLDGLTAGAGLALRNLQLTAELQDRYRDARARAAALAESRRRVVALEDEERRLLERDIHDGAQQQLVALAVNLRLVRARLERGSEQGAAISAGLREAVDAATTELLDVVDGRGRLIADQGLDAALRAVADTCPITTNVVGERLPRFPGEVEQALFYCCAEALQNVAKHAGATEVTIELHHDPRAVRVSVIDDGEGFAPGAGIGPRTGHGLQNIADRVAAVGGTVEVCSAPGAGTRIDLSAPVTEAATS